MSVLQGRRVGALAVAGALTVAAAAPAWAGTARVSDKRGDAPASTDIVSLTVSYPGDLVRSKVKIRDLRGSGVVAWQLSSEGPGGPDARGVVTVKATKAAGQPATVRVSYWREIGSGMDCPTTEVTWNSRQDFATMKVDMSCLEEFLWAAPEYYVTAKSERLDHGGRDRTRELIVPSGR